MVVVEVDLVFFFCVLLMVVEYYGCDWDVVMYVGYCFY